MSAAKTIVVLTGLFAALAHGRPAAATELVMFERAGCAWCARFDAEIAPIYPRTDESRTAPLRRVDLDGPRPADLAAIDPGPFTPTFVVVQDGREIGRIRGYPGESFFFGLLDRILPSATQDAKGS